MEEYLSFPKAKQDELKDVGGFVGGTFANDIRKAAYVTGRDLLTLDMDQIPAGGTDAILKRVAGLGCAAVVYSTRKHTGYAPRLRIVVPLDQTASADEYEPAARKLASLIGMEYCDPTTFDVARLMYWPSCCADGEYLCELFDHPFCSLTGLLGMYGDWTDVSQWPQVPGVDAVERRRLAKQEDPTTKRGIIGAFCRTYTISQAMEKFIPGMYEPTDIDGRYTYTGGSKVGVALVYEGHLFLYSHHSTDRGSGLLVKAFDRVRLQRYGDKDQDAKDGTPVNKLPSFVAMSRMAGEDRAVSDLLTREKLDQARRYGDKDQDAKDGTPVNKLPSFVAMSRMAGEDRAVSDLLTREKLDQARQAFQTPEGRELPEEDLTWASRLTHDGNGKVEKTINNAVIVLQNDPLLKGKIVTDEFASCGLILGKVPWSR